MSGELPVPSFLIIGAQKGATRWLRMNLGEHPEVFTAASELRFFSDPNRVERGLDAYRAEFSGWAGEPVVGEATPSYMMPSHKPFLVAERIDRALPGVHLLALLRNPVDRACSAFLHHIARGRIPATADLLARMQAPPPAEDPLELIAGGWYAKVLRPYVERFGARLRVLLHDDLIADPETLYAQALEHVGASPGYLPTRLARVRHSTEAPPGSALAGEDGQRRGPSDHERRALWPYFDRDVLELEDLIGRDLGRWRPWPPSR